MEIIILAVKLRFLGVAKFFENIRLARFFFVKFSGIFFALLFSQSVHASTVTVIGAGSNHTCAAFAEGGLKCWGAGTFGQLGDGEKLTRATPVAVPALAGVHVIAVGGGTYFTCALTSTGSIYCWGFNSTGQLGNGTYVASSIPVPVKLPTGPAVGLSVGLDYACLLDSFGNVYCWGNNIYGQLNRSVKQPGSSNVPIYAAGQNDIVSIAGTGMTTCLIDINGGGKCFGNNFYGQKGIGSKDDISGATYGAPSYVLGLSSNMISISSAVYDACGITTSHVISCWGLNTSYLQLGFPERSREYLTPVVVPGARTDAKAIFTQATHTCITTLSGAAQCWGNNTSGQVGRGTNDNFAPPGDVLTLSQGVISMALGYGHSCALIQGGSVKCWGVNTLSQLGPGSTGNSIIPVAVPL